MKSLQQSSDGSRNSYDLIVPPVVHFGHGRIAEVGSVASVLGKRIWLIHSIFPILGFHHTMQSSDCTIVLFPIVVNLKNLVLGA